MAVKSGQINGKSQHKGVEKAMSKPRKKQGNPDFRHRVSVSSPASKEIESRLFELISPGTFTNLKGVKDRERSLRSRVLTLPVMAAIVLSLVYRQVQHLTDVLRSLEIEGLIWVEATKVSKLALSQRHLTNLLDPQQLSAQDICDLYRRRWPIENVTDERLLALLTSELIP
ncbi:hypothetical protein [Nostoc sp.]|uniref:hypothetical protein n=1 Tax=Nostoc sp. TaxID=1180 RepID=UPI002FF9C4AE